MDYAAGYKKEYLEYLEECNNKFKALKEGVLGFEDIKGSLNLAFFDVEFHKSVYTYIPYKGIKTEEELEVINENHKNYIKKKAKEADYSSYYMITEKIRTIIHYKHSCVAYTLNEEMNHYFVLSSFIEKQDCFPYKEKHFELYLGGEISSKCLEAL